MCYVGAKVEKICGIAMVYERLVGVWKGVRRKSLGGN